MPQLRLEAACAPSMFGSIYLCKQMFSVMRFNNHLTGPPDRQEEVSIFFFKGACCLSDYNVLFQKQLSHFRCFCFQMSDHSQVFAIKLEGAADAQWVVSNTTLYKIITKGRQLHWINTLMVIQCGERGFVRLHLQRKIQNYPNWTEYWQRVALTVRLSEMRERSKTWFGCTCSTKG